MSLLTPPHAIQSKDGILAPLVTIWSRWLLEKEKREEWARMTRKVAWENCGRCKHTNSKHAA